MTIRCPRKLRRLACLIWCLFTVALIKSGMDLPEGLQMSNILDINRDSRIFEERLRKYLEYQSEEVNRTGPGEGGSSVILEPGEKEIVDKEMKKEGFSKLLNEKVSLDRGLKDYRPGPCQAVEYPKDLPTVSVIVIFCNELQRVVLRTVHSVINRTPPQYLREVILVDDASTNHDVGAPLDEHVQKTWPPGLVKIVRLPERQGLVRTRMAGVYAASGDVVVMVDGHTEASKGWAEPILARIKENNKTLIAPMIDNVNAQDLKYISGGIQGYQSFKWNMEFWWQTSTNNDPLQPIPSYGLVGCIMAMHRQTFIDMGGFDTEMDFWGGENVELPLRVWLCGGRVEILPCSRFAHMYRAGYGRPWNTTKGYDFFQKNTRRIAEVWLDEYKEQYYIYFNIKDKSDYGNITNRLALKKRLGCKSFKWFMETVMRPPKFLYNVNVTAWGQVRNGGGSMCLDHLGVQEYNEGPIGVFPCQSPRNQYQLFSLTWSGMLRRDSVCTHYNYDVPGKNVSVSQNCQLDSKHIWKYDPMNATIIHAKTQLCLDWEGGTRNGGIVYVILNPCNNKPTQKWTWENYSGPPQIQHI